MVDKKRKKSVTGKSSNGSKLSTHEKPQEARTKRSGDKLSVAKKPPELPLLHYKDSQHVFVKGDYLSGGKDRWRLWKQLGKGGFGEVWKVYRKDSFKFYAMKMESNPYFNPENNNKFRIVRDDDKEAKEKMKMRLKAEVALFAHLRKEGKPENTKHFVKVYDKGQTEDTKNSLGVKFIVMTLLGKSLYDIRCILLDKEFTMCTVFKFAIEATEALKHLHSFGYIHRDLKPENFAPGVGGYQKVVYLLDFGISKRVADKVGNELVMRMLNRDKAGKILGTYTYMSYQGLQNFEQSYVDDLESLLYVVFNLLDKDCGTPWKEHEDKITHIEKKIRLMNGDFKVFEDEFKLKKKKADADGYKDIRIPDELKKTVALVKNTDFAAIPDYAAFTRSFKDIAKAYKLNLNDDFDWEGLFPKPVFTKKTAKNDNNDQR